MSIKNIILHCSATVENKPFTVVDIDRWHKQRGFNKVGYHYVILLDGTIEKGRDDSEMGAHCLGHNKDSIGICYIGGLDKDGKPKDTRTKEQKEALFNLVGKLMLKYDIGVESLHCHNEFANKACPCFNIEDFINEFKEWITNEVE